jgi:hypothetical protein
MQEDFVVPSEKVKYVLLNRYFRLYLTSVADPGCLSRIQGQEDSGFWIPDPDPHQRILIFLTQKYLLLSSRMFIPGPDLDFLPIPDPGPRGQKSTGSRIRIRNVLFIYPYLKAFHILSTTQLCFLLSHIFLMSFIFRTKMVI